MLRVSKTNNFSVETFKKRKHATIAAASLVTLYPIITRATKFTLLHNITLFDRSEFTWYCFEMTLWRTPR